MLQLVPQLIQIFAPTPQCCNLHIPQLMSQPVTPFQSECVYESGHHFALFIITLTVGIVQANSPTQIWRHVFIVFIDFWGYGTIFLVSVLVLDLTWFSLLVISCWHGQALKLQHHCCILCWHCWVDLPSNKVVNTVHRMCASYPVL